MTDSMSKATSTASTPACLKSSMNRFFSLGRPGTVPILGKRFYIGSLRLDPGLRVGVAMQIDNSHNFHLADEEARCQFTVNSW